jgi:hypothetical protein
LNVLILESNKVSIGSGCAERKNELVIRDFLGTDRVYDGIGDVYELRHNTLTTHVGSLIHCFGVPERENRSIELSKEFVPFLIRGRFSIYDNNLAFRTGET